MKLNKLYRSIVELGIDADPRGKKIIDKELKLLNKKFSKLSESEKKHFDVERLINPYSDTRILYGDGSVDVKTVLLGIDIDSGELMLADYLRRQGTAIDLVLSHHPEGIALAALHDVMHMQADLLLARGVPVATAEHVMEKRISEVERRLLTANHHKSADTARLLTMPFMCVHTPADNFVTGFLQTLLDKKQPETLADIITLLLTIPEYDQAATQQAGPKIINGRPEQRCGEIVVDMTGGTEGAREAFAALAQAGVSTIVGMHFSEEHITKAREARLNVIIAGHMSSDVLGLNLLLDALEKKDALNVIGCSGFTRIHH